MTAAATTFRNLHTGADLLVLPNAWDAGSARLFESLGARAIATTSAGVAWSHGHGDGDALPVAIHIAAVREIVRVITVPLTVDIEGGYDHDPARVGENVRRFLDAGAVGINLEDGSGSPEVFCRKIEAARTAATTAGVALFINARTDVILKALAPGREIAEVIARAALYAGVGCDGLFVPGLVDRDGIREIASASPLPLNVMARPALPPADELRSLGVRRLSAGSAIAQAALGVSQRLAEQFLRGNSTALFAGAMPYGDINALMPADADQPARFSNRNRHGQ